jgi:hypothetical protein
VVVLPPPQAEIMRQIAIATPKRSAIRVRFNISPPKRDRDLSKL